MYNPYVPVEDVVLSKAERDFIMRCFAEGVNIAYDSIATNSVTAAGKKRTPRQLAKKQDKDFNNIRKHFEQTDDRASTEVNDDTAAPYRGAFTIPREGGAVVCMLIKLTSGAAKADIEKGLDVYAFNITDAEALFNVPIRHGTGVDDTNASHVHTNNQLHQVGDPHVFYGKFTVKLNHERDIRRTQGM